MIVAFQRPWWNGEKLFSRTTTGVEVPDNCEDQLPKSATILSAGEATKRRKSKKERDEAAGEAMPNTLSELSKLVAKSELEA